jgi:hypothetical protein
MLIIPFIVLTNLGLLFIGIFVIESNYFFDEFKKDTLNFAHLLKEHSFKFIEVILCSSRGYVDPTGLNDPAFSQAFSPLLEKKITSFVDPHSDDATELFVFYGGQFLN